jgi:hypothetical protein
MRLPQDPNKYLAQFRYVELGRFVPSLNKLIREKRNNEAWLVDVDYVKEYAIKNGNEGIYSSVFHYRDSRIGELILGPLYFDLDSDSIELSRQDAHKLVQYFARHSIPDESVRVYFTGSKGFHVECEPIAFGITPTNALPNIFRFIAGRLRDELELSTVDFAVYDRRRMWRVPTTRHQSTGLYKSEIGRELLFDSVSRIQEFCETPHSIQGNEEIKFDLKANEWYRSFTYAIEEQKNKKYTQADIVKRFESHGSKSYDSSYTDREFDPIKLFEGCPSIMRLWQKAETEHNLEHEERLFLCSILTYTDEGVEYLHAILRNCDDYNYEKSQSHIDDWIARREKGIGGKPYSCERANSVGVGCSDCNDRLEAKPKYEHIGNKLYQTSEMAAISPIRFAYSKRKDNAV